MVFISDNLFYPHTSIASLSFISLVTFLSLDSLVTFISFVTLITFISLVAFVSLVSLFTFLSTDRTSSIRITIFEINCKSIITIKNNRRDTYSCISCITLVTFLTLYTLLSLNTLFTLWTNSRNTCRNIFFTFNIPDKPITISYNRIMSISCLSFICNNIERSY